MRAGTPGLAVVALYAAIASYVMPVFPHGGSANELTRWATAASLAEGHGFEVSWLVPMVGPLVDAAAVGNRVYSNKAPGAAVLGLPAYAAARVAAGAPTPANLRWSWTAMRWLVSSLPLVLLALAWWRRGEAPLVIAVLLFATPLFVYSLLLFSHVLAAVAAFTAYRLLYRTPVARPRDEMLAGLVAGVAVLAEFPAAIVVLVLAAGLALRAAPLAMRMRTLARFAAGGAPIAIALAAYNTALFGSPWSLSYEHEAFPEWAAVAAQGFHGFTWPRLEHLYLLLLSPARGLFFCAPILLLAWPRVIAGARARDVRTRVRAAIVAASIVIVAAFGAPHGGWAFGPRYLVMIVPFFVEAIAEARLKSTWWVALLLAWSFVLCVLPALTYPFPPPEFAWPHATFFTPLLIDEGWLAPTIGAAAGLGAGWLAWTPALMALAAVFLVLWLAAGRARGFAAGLAAGAIVAVMICALPGLDNNALAWRRVTIAERFFKVDDRISASLQRALAGGDTAMAAALAPMAWTVADARGYAPNDWPYAPPTPLIDGPSVRRQRITDAHAAKRFDDAIAEARRAQRELPFAACQFGTYLATVLHDAGRDGEAARELEAVRPLAVPGATQDCLHSLVLLKALGLGQTAGIPR